MAGRADGHVLGINEFVGAWLARDFTSQPGSVGTPVPAAPLILLHDNSLPGATHYLDDELIQYTIQDRAGNLSLWRIDQIRAISIDPQCSTPPFLCGSWGYTEYTIDRTTINYAPGWGCDPACSVVPELMNVLPQNLWFVALSNTAGERLRSVGGERVIIVRQGGSDSSPQAGWATCLSSGIVDEVDFADQAAAATMDPGTYQISNAEIVEKRAL